MTVERSPRNIDDLADRMVENATQETLRLHYRLFLLESYEDDNVKFQEDWQNYTIKLCPACGGTPYMHGMTVCPKYVKEPIM